MLSDDIRKAIIASGLTCTDLAILCYPDNPRVAMSNRVQLNKFVRHGHMGLSMDRVDRLCEVLGLRLTGAD